jgi:L-lactate dehydrogenase (cytochrome)/(S)-mandelate dehydrogenase
MKAALTIADLRDQCRRRLPKILFDWIDGGAGDELGLRRNEEVFRRFSFIPRYLLDVSERSQRKMLFGATYDSPFGIAPTGYAGLFRPGADLMLAQAARDANIPFIMSGVSVDPIEDVMKIAPDHVWYQLYGATDVGITEDLIRRAADAGCRGLVITIDIPVAARRERDLRNGISIPLRVNPKLFLDALMHPRWTCRYLLSGGTPRMANWTRYAPHAKTAGALFEFVNSHSYCVQTWDHLERLRQLWPGKLIVKGVMHPDDSRRAVAMGADGLIVSNHGGRQYDRAPTAIEALPSIRAAIGSSVPVMLDGGIRRGSDVLAALACGASYVFAGRAMLYGVVAGGLAGARCAISILREELDQLMGQIGCTDLADATPDMIFKG